MLKLRVITAVVLLAVLVPCLLASSPWPFGLLCAAFTMAGAWEWGRLSGLNGAAAAAYGASLALPLALAAASGAAVSSPGMGWLAAALGWVALSAWALRRGTAGWQGLGRTVRLAIGWVVLGAAWLAFVQARGLGVAFFLSTAAIVWVSDISAYFAGHRWGRRKLAPAVSPGKTWEGVMGAVVGVLLVSLAWLGLERTFGWPEASIHRRLWDAAGPWAWGAALMLLTALGVVGDLVESLIKRAAGAKDSSQLLPGHGGVLDRIDALLPVLPTALALVALASRWRGL